MHPYMDVVSERIGNWASVRGFRQAVSTAGEFPTLRDLLPDFNGGLVTVEESAAALAELARFIALDSVGADAFLVDLDTGRELWSTPGDVYWSTPYTIGYDANGLYVVNRGGRSPVEVFRAMRVGQLPVPDGTGAPVGWTQLTDLDDGTLIVVRALPLRGPEPPRRMGVVTREVTPGDYAYLTEPLTAVLRVSVATGNAVFWE